MQNEELRSSQLNLEESRNKYIDLFDFAPIGYLLINEKELITEVNLTACRLLGVEKSKILKKAFTSFICKEDQDIYHRKSKILLETLKRVQFSLRIKSSGSSFFWAELILVLLPGENDSQLIKLTISDISGRKKDEETLKISEERFWHLFHNMHNGVAVYLPINGGEDFIFEDINKSGEKLSKVRRNEVVGKKLSEMFPGAEDYGLFEAFRKTLKSGKPESIPLKVYKDNRILQYVENTVYCLPSGEVVAIYQDTSERERAIEELHQSEDKFRTYIEKSPVGIFVTDENGKYCDCNDSAIAMTGYSREELFKLSISDISPEHEQRKTAESFMLLKNKGKISIEIYLLRKDSSLVPVLLEAARLPNGGFMAFCTDITKRKLDEEELRTAKILLEKTFDSLKEAVFIVEPYTRTIIACNAAVKDIFGYSGKEVIGRTTEFLHVDRFCFERFGKSLFHALDGGGVFNTEFQMRRKDGELFFTENTVTEIKDSIGKRTGVVSVIHDITERKHAEKKILDSENRFRALFEQAAIGVALVETKTGRFVRINKKYCDFLGYTQEEMLKKSFQDVTFTEDVKGNIENNARLISGTIMEFSLEKRYIRKDGGVVWGKLTASPLWTAGTEPNEYLHIAIVEDITERVFAEQQREYMLEAGKLVLENKPFEETAKIIFEFCKEITGAKSGCVTLLSKNGEENEVLFLDSGGLDCTVDESLPMPVRGLRKVAYEKKKGVSKNDFGHSELKKYMSKGHVKLKNILFVPLIIHGEAVGVIGLANKEGDFTDADAEAVTGFGEYISIALLNSKNLMELIESRHKAENYLQTAGVMMVGLDREANVTMINKKGCEMLGYSQKYIIGKNWIENFIDEKDRRIAGRIFQHLIKGIYPKDKYVEGTVKCRYNKTKRIGWRHTALTSDDGNITGTLSSGEDITEMIKMSEEINRAQNELSTLSAHIEKVREEEKTFLSRAIHDELGQAITALKLDADWISSKIPASEMKIKEKLSGMSSLLEDTLDKVQKMAFELRPDFLDFLGLIPAIQYQAHSMEEKTGIKFLVKFENESLNINKETSTALYRIFQESLANIIRHSKARKATIGFKEESGKLYMSIKDNGVGMKEEKINSSKSLGLIGIRERIKTLGGELIIASKPGKGTSVNVSIPLNIEKKI